MTTTETNNNTGNGGQRDGSKTVEFVLALQVVKHCGQNGAPDLYTIGVWSGMALLPISPSPLLKAICHNGRLEQAEAALAKALVDVVPVVGAAAINTCGSPEPRAHGV